MFVSDYFTNQNKMKTLKERKLELAILEEQQEMIRVFVVDIIETSYRDGMSEAEARMSPINQFFKNFADKVRGFKATQFPDIPSKVTISGFAKDENVSHYDIDEAINAQNFEGVITDSESGQFFCYCNTENVKQVEEYLHRFPSLKYKTYVDEDEKMVFNKGEKKKLLEGVEVPSPLGYLQSMIQTYKDMKAEYEQKIMDAEQSLYEASNEFAKEHLTPLKRSDVDFHKNKLIKLIKEDYEAKKNGSKRDEEVFNEYKKRDVQLIKDYLDQDVYDLKRAFQLISYQIQASVVFNDYIKNNLELSN